MVLSILAGKNILLRIVQLMLTMVGFTEMNLVS